MDLDGSMIQLKIAKKVAIKLLITIEIDAKSAEILLIESTIRLLGKIVAINWVDSINHGNAVNCNLTTTAESNYVCFRMPQKHTQSIRVLPITEIQDCIE